MYTLMFIRLKCRCIWNGSDRLNCACHRKLQHRILRKVMRTANAQQKIKRQGMDYSVLFNLMPSVSFNNMNRTGAFQPRKQLIKKHLKIRLSWTNNNAEYGIQKLGIKSHSVMKTRMDPLFNSWDFASLKAPCKRSRGKPDSLASKAMIVLKD